ncbi:MAG: STAS domain-containing protein [Paenisporosarcina sp.]|nr:STAS domain-containing protein [Paenisporosarcina sp.]
MNIYLQSLGKMIVEKKVEIANAVHTDRMGPVVMTEEERQQFEQIEQHIIDIRANFISLFGEALIDHLDQQKAVDNILSWGKETGEYFFNLGVPLDEALKDASFYRKHIWQAIQVEAETQNMSAATVFETITIFDPLLDKATYSFSLTYVESHQRSLDNAQKAFIEISVPVVPLFQGVAVLPLIGTIDSERAIIIMEKTLHSATKLQLNKLIIDLSGIHIVDSAVAEQIFKIVDALSLIGVRTVITGIRPEVAQIVVSQGINFNGLTIKGDLSQAMNEIFINLR